MFVMTYLVEETIIEMCIKIQTYFITPDPIVGLRSGSMKSDQISCLGYGSWHGRGCSWLPLRSYPHTLPNKLTRRRANRYPPASSCVQSTANVLSSFSKLPSGYRVLYYIHFDFEQADCVDEAIPPSVVRSGFSGSPHFSRTFYLNSILRIPITHRTSVKTSSRKNDVSFTFTSVALPYDASPRRPSSTALSTTSEQARQTSQCPLR